VASKVSTLLLKEKIVDRRRYPQVDAERCDGCRVCENVCSFGAIQIKEEKAELNRDVCRGCGACTANCPLFALKLKGFDEGFLLTIERFSKEGKIVAFVCMECAGAAMDLAAFEQRLYDSRLFIVSVPCLGKVSAVEMLKAINWGAEAVVLLGCMQGRCHYGNDENIRRNYELAKEALSKAGKGEKLARLYTCGAETVGLMQQLHSFCKGV
jgi:heterodisulfide reductase subunit A